MTHAADNRALRRARLREAIEEHGAPINGIDYAESLRGAAPGGAPRVLVVLFAPQAPALAKEDFRIEGGDRIRGLQVTAVETDAQDPRRLFLQLDRLGDFSTYRVRVDPRPQNFDPMFSEAEVSFRLDCASDIDCEAEPPGTAEPGPGPRIDYLARDYNALRSMLFDRLRVTAPHWQERNPADLGVTLVELFAYVGDMLNYRLDAIDAEAYLATARSRISARRHARLVDYNMHDGRNARAFVQFAAAAGVGTVPVAAQTRVLTDLGTGSGTGARRGGRISDPDAVRQMAADGAVVFETLHAVDAHPALNRIELHDWGLVEARLEAGATSATLRDPDGVLAGLLAPEQFLVLEEAMGVIADAQGNRTGRRADADPSKRWAVRLTSVTAGQDPLGDPGGAGPLALVEVTWRAEDALPFALSSERLPVTDPPAAPGPFESAAAVQSAGVARGGVALADEGRLLDKDEEIEGGLRRPAVDASAPLSAIDPPRRFRPRLKRTGLVFAARYDAGAPASASLAPPLGNVRPAIAVQDNSGLDWTPQLDLVDSREHDRHFVVELNGDGTASLRFGDDRFGRRPNEGETFTARYRIGRGAAAKVGRESLVWVLSNNNGLVAARNPLPAAGALAPETVDSVRAKAPGAFREQKRAITAEDYARFAEQHPLVQRAVATFRWTGAWRTLFITVDLSGGADVDETARDKIVAHLEPFRRAGHEIAVDGPLYTPIELAMRVCVEPDHFRSRVRERLAALFSRRGLFDPNKWSFGDPVHLSRLYAAALEVEGVRHVDITTFRRQNDPSHDGLGDGVLALDRREIAILDNDPNFPGRGVAAFEMEGGL